MKTSEIKEAIAGALQGLWAWQQAWRLHVYHLTVSTSAGVIRTHLPIQASQALKDWFSEETTGYFVTCHDQSGASVTKAQLRVVARHAYGA